MIYDYEYFLNNIPIQLENILSIIFIVFGFLLFLLLLMLTLKTLCNWIIYKKAGKRGWESIIPIYNTMVKFEFLNMPIWGVILYYLPVTNIIMTVIININLAKKFKKDYLFAVGLILLPIMFYPILAFGNSKYDSTIKGIFENETNVNNDYSYCTNCGTKIKEKYCTNCGAKREE